MSVLAFILLGLIAGAIARGILRGDYPGGILATTLIGVAGAMLGGVLASAAGLGELRGFFDVETWLIAVGGSVLLLFLYGLATGERGGRTRA